MSDIDAIDSIIQSDLFSSMHPPHSENLNNIISRIENIAYLDKGGSIKVEREWGGKEPPKTKIEIHAYIQDSRGNRLNSAFSRNQEGRNKIQIEANTNDQKKQ